MLIEIILQLCDILTYIHNQSPVVIHRDIKPENIIIDGKNNVKLIDFGIARDFREEAEKDTQIAGTRPYMAPEQFGSEQTDNRADIYSLGVVMINLATGKTDKHNLKTTYPYKELVPIVEKCIKKDRNQRFRTAGQLKKRILWAQQRVTQNILLSVLVCAAIIAALVCGYYIGQALGHESGFFDGHETGYDLGYDLGLIDGFDSGIEYIMGAPTVVNRPFTQEELYEEIIFENKHLDMAVRYTLNMAYTDVEDLEVLRNHNNLQEVDVSYTRVTDLVPLVRPGDPVTVRCAGLPAEVVDKVRGRDGIIIVLDYSTYPWR